MVKLNKSRIKWLVRQVVRFGKTPAKVAHVYGVTARRVRQLVQQFKEHGKMPELKKERRPRTYLSEEQKETIDKAFEETRLSARLLYYELKRRETPVPKNKLYGYLKSKGLVKANPKNQKKRKRCRYERKHSGSLIHGDWHRTTENPPHCILWEDDASRRILAGGEFKSVNTENSIKTFKEAQKEAAKYNVLIRQANTGRGTEFFSNKKEGTSKFQQYLKKQGTQHILSRVKNPQTNGKLERLFYEYDKHRWRFKTLQEWIDWYNNRLHGSLNLEWAEMPNEAFIR
jgi:transposase InsO family protein